MNRPWAVSIRKILIALPALARVYRPFGVLLLGFLVIPGCLNWESLYGARCGDGVVEGSEACDDGNASDGDACNSLCQLPAPFCGDGHVDPGEACDDGNALDEDDCLSDCQEASCGDGQLWVGHEGCDDSNTVPGDGCSPSCQVEPPTCGNGALDPGEPCDDGNISNEDSCLRGCSLAVCGDGFVRTGDEECDFGAVGLAVCSRGCQVCLNDARTYSRGNSHCYEYHPEALSYAAARAVCAENNGYVWVVTAALEASDVLLHLPQASADVWLSLDTSAAPYAWVTGEVTKYRPWAKAQPSDTTLGCVMNHADDTLGSIWSSSACTAKHAFICERNTPYEDPVSHHVYRLRSDALPLAAATDACVALGGHLLRIETAAEQLQLAKWFSLELWLGAARKAGNFQWQDGGVLGYSAFADGQPDNATGDQDCLVYNRTHTWNDVTCEGARAFVCELE